MADKTVTYKIEFDAQGLDEGLKKLNKEIANTSTVMKQMRKDGKENTDGYGTQKQKLKELKAEQALYARNTQNLNKIMRDKSKVTEREIGHLEKLKAELSLVTANINKMSKAELYNNKIGGAAIRKQKALTDELKKAEEAGGRHTRSVGKYKNALKGLWNQFKMFVGLYAIIGLFRKFLNVNKEFEQSMANLASVMGVAKENTKDLEKYFRKLGATTQYTANEIAKLATELARLGFSSRDIKNMTADVLNFATALNTDLANAGTLAGAVIRQFGYDTRDSGKVMDILAKSTTISALSFEKLNTALPIVGTTAKIAGVSLEKVTAQLGVLSNRGLDASMSATALRNIFLELAKKGMTWDEAMTKINESTDKNATSLAIFGKRAAAAGVIMSETGEEIAGYTKELKDAQGTIDEMAEKQLSTFSGALKLLKSAWDEFMLSLDESGGITDKLATSFRWIAKNLKDIIRWLAIAATGFIAYKAAIVAQTVVMTTYNSVTNLAKISTIGLSTAMKTMPWAAIISALAMVVMYFATWKSETKEITDYTKGFNDELGKQQGIMDSLFDTLKDNNASNLEKKMAMERLNTEYKQYLPYLITEKTSLEDITKAQKLSSDALYQNILLKSKQAELEKVYQEGQKLQLDLMHDLSKRYGAITKEQQAALDLKSKEITETKSLAEIETLLANARRNDSAVYVEGLSIAETKLYSYALGQKKITEESKKINDAFSSLIITTSDLGDVFDDENGAIDKNTERLKDNVFEYVKSIELKQLLKGYTEDLTKIRRKETSSIKELNIQYKEMNLAYTQGELDRLKITLNMSEAQVKAYLVIQKVYDEQKKAINTFYDNYNKQIDKGLKSKADEVAKLSDYTALELKLLNDKLVATEKKSEEEHQIRREILIKNEESEIQSFQKSAIYAQLSEEKRNEILLAIHEKYIQELKDLDEEYEEEKSTKIQEWLDINYDKIKNYYDKVAQLMRTSSDLSMALNQKELIELNNTQLKKYGKRREDLQNIIDNDKATQEEKEQASKDLQDLDEKIANEKSDLLEKQFEESKSLRIAMVWLNAAEAVLGTWAGYSEMGTYGTIVAGVQTAAILSLAAIQSSNISNESYEKMAGGGLLDGPLHSQGGIKTEMEGNEYVVNRSATAQYKPLLDVINAAGNSTGNNESVKQIINEDSLAEKIGAEINTKKVYVVSTDITEQQKVDTNIKNRSQF